MLPYTDSYMWLCATGWIEPEELRALVALWYYRLALPDAARGDLADEAVSAMSLYLLAAKSASATRSPTRCVVSRMFCFRVTTTDHMALRLGGEKPSAWDVQPLRL